MYRLAFKKYLMHGQRIDLTGGHMSILLPNPTIEKHEKALDWMGALDYCLLEWKRSPNDVISQIRLITEAWYLLSYWEQIDHMIEGKRITWLDYMVPLDYQFLYSVIHQTQNNETPLYLSDSKYLCITGYLMKIQPEWFVGSKYTNLNDCRQEGLNRIMHVPLVPGDECSLFCNIILNGLCVDIEQTESMFPGKSEVDLYFKSILANRH